MSELPGGGITIKPWPDVASTPPETAKTEAAPATAKTEAAPKKAAAKSKATADEKVGKGPPKPTEKPIFKPLHKPAPPLAPPPNEQPPLTATPPKEPADKPEPEDGGVTKDTEVAGLTPYMSAEECRSMNDTFGKEYFEFARSPGLSDTQVNTLLKSLGGKAHVLWSQCAKKIDHLRRLSIQRSFVLFFMEDFDSALESFKKSLSLPLKPGPPDAHAPKREQLLRAFKIILSNCSDQEIVLQKFKAAQLYYQREMYGAARTVFTKLRETYGWKCPPLSIYAGDLLEIIKKILGK